MITGDLINKASDAAMAAEYKRICAKLDPKIKLFSVPGNHDVENEPTQETLARYRERFGADYYTFRAGDIAGIVLNSNLEKGAEKVPDEAAKMEAWFRTELERAKHSGVKHVILFQHIPLFLKTPDEDDQYFNIPKRCASVICSCCTNTACSWCSPATITAMHRARTAISRWSPAAR